MPEFSLVIALLALWIAAACAAAGAINFFWETGFRRAFGYGAFLSGVFLLFWATGLWEGASRHSWGVLGPAFLLMLVLAWLAIQLGLRFWRWRERRRTSRSTDGEN